jgi:ABC-type lipoprotein export system ATPase subunit
MKNMVIQRIADAGILVSEGTRITIKTIGLKKTYYTEVLEVPVLKGVDLEVKPGELHMILGPSGSGKTTFLNMVGGMDKFDEGQILIRMSDGIVDLASFSEYQLMEYRRRYVGFIFQFYNLIPIFNALENVELAARFANIKEPEKKSKIILEKVGLGHRLYQYPGTLSGGEQQRVAIARALVKEPLLVLADEPTGNLDSQKSEDVFKILQGLAKESNAAVIVVTHDGDLAKKYSAQVHRLKGGVLD